MNRFIAFASIFILAIFMFAYPISASTTPTEHISCSLTQLLTTTNKELIEGVLDPDLFDDSLQNLNLDGKPMLFRSSCPFFFVADMTYEESIRYVYNNYASEIIILDSEPVILRPYQSKTKIGAAEYEVQSYVQDIIDGDIIQTFLGTECQITNIVCFDAITSRLGATVIYETNQGLYVRYYETDSSNALEYTWNDFTQLAQAYYDYISAYENNYDEYGNALNGVHVSFVKFAQNPSLYTVSSSNTDLIMWLIPIIFAILIFSVIIFFHFRNKK